MIIPERNVIKAFLKVKKEQSIVEYRVKNSMVTLDMVLVFQTKGERFLNFNNY